MIKRVFDFSLAVLGILLLSGLLLVGYLVSSFDTQSNGLFIQKRIGQFGNPFQIFKLKTVHPKTNEISAIGTFLRKSKMDELPQLLNIIRGEMSFVGPRPDIPGYYDVLQGEARQLLELKPGLTSTASLKYANEDLILAKQGNPIRYNDMVIFPDKVKINLDYYYRNNLVMDIQIIIKTICSS